jgi:hypothetical protein
VLKVKSAGGMANMVPRVQENLTDGPAIAVFDGSHFFQRPGNLTICGGSKCICTRRLLFFRGSKQMRRFEGNRRGFTL